MCIYIRFKKNVYIKSLLDWKDYNKITNLMDVFVAWFCCILTHCLCQFSKGQYLLPEAGFQGDFLEHDIFILWNNTTHTCHVINCIKLWTGTFIAVTYKNKSMPIAKVPLNRITFASQVVKTVMSMFTFNHLADAFTQSDVLMRIIEATRPSREQQYTSAMTSLS